MRIGIHGAEKSRAWEGAEGTGEPRSQPGPRDFNLAACLKFPFRPEMAMAEEPGSRGLGECCEDYLVTLMTLATAIVRVAAVVIIPTNDSNVKPVRSMKTVSPGRRLRACSSIWSILFRLIEN